MIGVFIIGVEQDCLVQILDGPGPVVKLNQGKAASAREYCVAARWRIWNLEILARAVEDSLVAQRAPVQAEGWSC